MSNKETLSKIKKLKEISRSISSKFDALYKETQDELLVAEFFGETQKALDIRAQRKRARKSVDKALDLLVSQTLSSETVNDLVKALKGQSREAAELLKQMQKLGRTLDRIKKAADLAASVLTTVLKFI